MSAKILLFSKNLVGKCYYLGLLITLVLAFNGQAQQQAALQLATLFDKNVRVNQYLVSEKLDGIRGYWTGRKMLTRSGREIKLPGWFTKDFPDFALDGELWIARGQFELISALVRTKNPDPNRWKSVKFMVFDLPSSKLVFSQRYQQILTHLKGRSAYLAPVPQFEVKDLDSLHKLLKKYVANGAEGLMLHKKTALYLAGRSQNIFKLKPLYDAEAIVIAYVPGKGKYQGMMGALRVRTSTGIEFSIGTGFSDAIRKNPPPIGSKITYQYRGVTKNSIPRFASYYRVRSQH